MPGMTGMPGMPGMMGMTEDAVGSFDRYYYGTSLGTVRFCYEEDFSD